MVDVPNRLETETRTPAAIPPPSWKISPCCTTFHQLGLLRQEKGVEVQGHFATSDSIVDRV